MIVSSDNIVKDILNTVRIIFQFKTFFDIK